MAGLEGALTPLLTALGQFLAADPSPPPPGASERDRALGVLTRLESLLAADDTRAGDLWLTGAVLAQSVLGPDAAARLGGEIEAFAFDAALATLRAAIEDKVSANERK